MKRLLQIALLAISAVSVARAQGDGAIDSQANASAAAEFANTSATLSPAPGTLLTAAAPLRFAPAFSLTERTSFAASSLLGNAPSAANPVSPEASPAAPEPKYVYGNRNDFRWQLGLGVSLVRFRSPFFYATGVGTNTSITYFTNEWLGVEGNVNTSFAPTIARNEHVKYASYGAGPKIAWRGRILEPWAHAIFGGAHILPQVGNQSQNGFGMQFGGGVDYRFYPHLSARVEVDYIKTHLLSAWENSAQANLDIVLHF